ncbi:MAG: hypothetical protein CMJ52_01445 [Planctomycetaceae bacterium]|nr:hypothetical protein [Planctomycetaceae bacterium]
MKYIVRSVDGREYGPFGSDELRELADQRRLGPGDFVRREMGRTWSPFERIPGLGDRGSLPSSDPSTLDSTEPVADGEVLGLETDVRDPMPETDAPERDAATHPPPSRSVEDHAGSGHELDLARASANAVALVEHGVLVERLPGEVDVFTLSQSFFDTSRKSFVAAMLGRRGRLICTNRRVAAILPDLMTQSIRIAYPERIGSIGIERRTSPVRLVFGALLLLNAIFTLIGTSLFGSTMAALDAAAGTALAGASGGAGLAIATVFGVAGVLLLLTSTTRALVVDDGDAIEFPCGRITVWHLGRLDESRNAALADPAPGKRVDLE